MRLFRISTKAIFARFRPHRVLSVEGSGSTKNPPLTSKSTHSERVIVGKAQ